MQEVDIPPSSRQNEPFFGSGALPLLGQLLGAAFGICLLILIAFLGLHFKGMIFPEKAHAPALQPGETTMIDVWTIKRIN